MPELGEHERAPIHLRQRGAIERELDLSWPAGRLHRFLKFRFAAPFFLAIFGVETNQRAIQRAVAVDAVDESILENRRHEMGAEGGVGPDFFWRKIFLQLHQCAALAITL